MGQIGELPSTKRHLEVIRAFPPINRWRERYATVDNYERTTHLLYDLYGVRDPTAVLCAIAVFKGHCDGKQMTKEAIAGAVHVSRSTAGRKLKLLERLGVVKRVLDGQSQKPQLEIIYILEPRRANSQVVIGQKVPRIIKQQMTALKTIQNSSILDTDAEIAP